MNRFILLIVLIIFSRHINAQILVPAQAYEHTFNSPGVTMSEDVSCHAFTNPTNTAWGQVDVYLAGWGNGPDGQVTVQFTKPSLPDNVVYSEILPYNTGYNIAVGAIYNSNTSTMQVLVAYELDGFKLDIYDITSSPTNPLKFISTKDLTNEPNVNFGRHRIRMDSHIDRAAVIWDHPNGSLQIIGCDQGNWGNVLDINIPVPDPRGADLAITEANGVPLIRMVYYYPPFSVYAPGIVSTTLDFTDVMTAMNLVHPFGGAGYAFGPGPGHFKPHLVIDSRDYDDYENWAFACTFDNWPGVFVGYNYEDAGTNYHSGIWVNGGGIFNTMLWNYNVASPSLHYGGGPDGADQIMVGWYASNGSYNGYIGLAMTPDATGLVSQPDYLEFTNATSPVLSLSGLAFSKEDKKLAPHYLYSVYYNRQSTSSYYDLHHAFHKWGSTVFKNEAKMAIESKSNTFPNPFNSYISKTINVMQDGNLNIRLTDVTGKVVAQYNQSVLKGNQTIHMKDLEKVIPGTYYLSTFINNERIQTEVIVKN